MTHDVFISHSSLDKLAADAVCHGLEAKGIRCWMAPRDQFAGKPYGEQISEAIKSAQVMVLVFSEHVNRSQAVLNEINIAANANLTIVPFRIASVEFNPELNYYLGRTHWLDAFPQPVDAYIDALAATVQRNLPRAADASAPSPQSSSQASPSAQPSIPPPPQSGLHSAPPAPPHAPRHHVNYTAVIVLGMVFAFILAIVFAGMNHKPSPAQERVANVVAQAVANAIQTGEQEDRQPSKAGAPPTTPKPPQDVPY